MSQYKYKELREAVMSKTYQTCTLGFLPRIPERRDILSKQILSSTERVD